MTKYIPMGSNKGFEVEIVGEDLLFKYKAFNERERRYIIGNTYRIPILLLKKIVEDPSLVRGLLK